MRAQIAAVNVVLWSSVLIVSVASAQAPPAQPKIWTVAASAGLALTNGNTDTWTANAAYDLTYDPKTRNIVKSDALWIRGETEDTLTALRLGFNVRDEYRLTARMFAFGQNQFLRDEFKLIDYLVAPAGGIGYSLFNSDQTKLSVDGGVGGVWEKNPNVDVQASGSVVLGEKLSQALTSTATLTQSFSGLWKMKDFDDALMTVGVGLAASVSTRTQLKVEVLDTFKNKPPTPDVQKNDVALLMSLVYKI